MKTDHLTIEHQSNELELKKLKNLVDYLLLVERSFSHKINDSFIFF